MTELPELNDQRDQVTAQGHRLDGTSCTLTLVCHSSGAWTLYGLPYDMEYDEHGSGPGVRLTAAAMTGLCQAVLERAQ